MSKEPLVAWSQFEVIMRPGVLHAMDMAAELARYDLVVPLPTHLDNTFQDHVDVGIQPASSVELFD